MIKYKIIQDDNRVDRMFVQITKQSENLYSIDGKQINGIFVYSAGYPEFQNMNNILCIRGGMSREDCKYISVPIYRIYQIVGALELLNEMYGDD